MKKTHNEPSHTKILLTENISFVKQNVYRLQSLSIKVSRTIFPLVHFGTSNSDKFQKPKKLDSFNSRHYEMYFQLLMELSILKPMP